MTFTFDEFFESGMEESVSPFLRPEARKWGKNLELKSSLLAALFLFVSYFSSHPSLFILFSFFFAGIPALISSLKDLLSFEINIDVLMTLAAFASILIGSGREGALLLVLFSFSGALEEAVRSKARGKLTSMKKMAPTKACVVEADGRMIERSVRDIGIGSEIVVKAGEIVPLDGIVIGGSSSVNCAHLTGESDPLPKQVGDEVPGGARNLDGSLTLRVLRTSSASTIARIALLIEEAEKSKPKLERWFDRLSRGYALTIISLSVLFALFLPFLFEISYLGREGSIYRALAFLIAASPCALIIALPIAYLSAISASASKGILLKGGVVLDALASCKVMALDKTGTLTEGVLECVGIVGMERRRALAFAVALERGSTHPIGEAICRMGEKEGVVPVPITSFHSTPGFGLSALHEGKPIAIGNLSFILLQLPSEKREWLEKECRTLEASGEALAILKVADEIAFFRFKDPIRKEAKEVMGRLQEECGLQVLILSGDHEASVARTAGEVGIETFYADLRPDEKLKMIDGLAKKENLAMVGDGINDAPALTRASVGISMGKGGSQTAVDASDIVLLQDDIELLPWLVKKARQTVTVVRQNLFFAAGAIVVATTPALLGWIPLWMAVLLHEGGTVLVGLNALRLLAGERKAPESARGREQTV